MRTQAFARVADGVVVEIVAIPESASLSERYHPDIVESCYSLDSGIPVRVGWLLTEKGFVPPPPVTRTADEVRAERNARLAACDWTQLQDADLTKEQQEAWQLYRASLRAVPSQPGFPEKVTWPTPPSSK